MECRNLAEIAAPTGRENERKNEMKNYESVEMPCGCSIDDAARM